MVHFKYQQLKQRWSKIILRDTLTMDLDSLYFLSFFIHHKLYNKVLLQEQLCNNSISLLFVYMLWFNFILSSNFIFLCFKLIIIHYNTQKQKKIKFEPRIKLNHNIYKISLNACLLWKVRVIVIQAAKIVTCMLTPMRCNKLFCQSVRNQCS